MPKRVRMLNAPLASARPGVNAILMLSLRAGAASKMMNPVTSKPFAAPEEASRSRSFVGRNPVCSTGLKSRIGTLPDLGPWLDDLYVQDGRARSRALPLDVLQVRL